MLTRGLHLLILWTLAAAQPLFDLLRRNPEFFAIRGSPGGDLVVFAVALVLLPPLGALLVEAVLGLVDARLALGLHLLVVAVLVAAIALPLLKRTGSGSSAVLLPAALVVGALGAAVYARWRPARSFLTVLSPAAILLLVLFLFFSPVTELVTGDEAEAQLGRDTTDAPVVMLVLDELPLTSLLGADGRIDGRRYPNFAALARESYWFRNTAAVDGFTDVAVPALLTGQRPRAGELPNFADHPDNLFTLLAGRHRLRVSESITQLCPRELCRRRQAGFGERIRSLSSDLQIVSLHLLLPDDLRDGLPSIDSSWQNFRAGPDVATAEPAAANRETEVLRRFESRGSGRREQAEGFAAEAGARPRDARPALDFAHLLLPHVPWQYLPDGSTYGRAAEVLGLEDEVWTDQPGATDVPYQRHLLQLGLVDRLLGRLLGRLRARDVFDEALIAVVADHGVAFRPGQPRRGPRPANAAELLPVPFFVKAPGQRKGRVVDTQLQTVDVVPTIADLLDLRLGWRVDGRSAFAPGADRSTVTITDAGRDPVTLRQDELRLAERVALRRKLDLFGADDGPFALYRLGPRGGLVGRSVTSLARTAPGEASATLNGGDALNQVDRRSGYLPVHVTGQVSGVDGEILLAVNGRIAAVTRPVASDGSQAFSALLPPSLVRDGPNRLEVFALEERAGGLALALLARAGGGRAAYRRVRDEIRAADGRRFRIVEGRLRGFVDRSIADEETVELSGWASTAATRPVERVVAFAQGRVRFSGPTTVPRPDITANAKAPPASLGFDFELPRSVVPERREPVTVYALSGDVASSLPWYCGTGADQAVGC